MSSPVTAIRVQ